MKQTYEAPITRPQSVPKYDCLTFV